MSNKSKGSSFGFAKSGLDDSPDKEILLFTKYELKIANQSQ